MDSTWHESGCRIWAKCQALFEPEMYLPVVWIVLIFSPRKRSVPLRESNATDRLATVKSIVLFETIFVGTIGVVITFT